MWNTGEQQVVKNCKLSKSQIETTLQLETAKQNQSGKARVYIVQEEKGRFGGGCSMLTG